jgi:hypothetical protein
MSMRSVPLTACVALAVMWVTTAAGAAPKRPAPAGADPVKEACARAFDEGQEARDASHFASAREAFRRCADPTCPALVRLDCSKGLASLEERSPTLVFGARDASGSDVLDARVEIDDVVVAERLDGRPVSVDPGPHTVRFRGKSGEVAVQRIVVRPGEKDRPILVSLAGSAQPSGPPPGPLPGASLPPGVGSVPQETRESSRAGLAIAGLTLGGVAVATFAGGLALGLVAAHDVHGLEAEPCAATQTCSASAVEAVRTKLAVSDVLIGVSAVSAGVSVTLLIVRATRRAPPVGLEIGPRPGGAQAGLHVLF